MIWLMVAILAVVQGIAEFLPISSSGHLRLLGAAFGVEQPQTLLDVMLHVGTLVAVVIVYRALVGRMLVAVGRALWHPSALRARWTEDSDLRLAVYVVIATIPTGVIGVALGDRMEGLASVGFVGAALIANGGVLLLLRALTIGRWRATEARPRRSLSELRFRDALFIGTAQGLGIFRGISRSGSTITAGLVAGLDQEAAAALSFLLSIPAILGALVLKIEPDALGAEGLVPALVGAALAAVVGVIALLLLLRMLRRGHLHLFAYYCFALGAAAAGWQLLGGA